MRVLTLTLAVCTLSALPAFATVVYDNGPDALNDTYYNVSGFSVTNSFTLSSAFYISQINLQVDVPVGNSPVSVDWMITTAEFGGTTIASATGAALSGGIDHPWSPGGNHIGDVYQVSFDVPDVFLAAGTYWLQLQNGTSTGGQGLGWATGANNLGTGGQTSGGPVNTIPTESFSLATPEPATSALIGAGMLALAFIRRRAR